MSEPVPIICWDDADSGVDPRRSEDRTTFGRHVELVILDSFERPLKRVETPAINITRGGIGLFCDQPLSVGGHVIVVMGAGKDRRVTAGGIVRFCSAKPIDQRYHRVGVQFVPREAMANAFANLDNWRLTA